MQMQQQYGRSTREAIDTAHELRCLLDQLGDAQRASNQEEATRLENQIMSMVPRGCYEGFVDDDAHVSLCKVNLIKRADARANSHTFVVVYRVFGPGGRLSLAKTMDLIEFVAPINRPVGCYGKSYVGPRFRVHVS